MKKYLLFLFLFAFSSAFSQSFNGQWKGQFSDASTSFFGLASQDVDYVLELECNGSDVTGYSYTYFTEGGKRYYTICKLSGTLSRTTKEVIVTEYERTKYNTPPDFRNCFQTHRLKYIRENTDTESLQGTWVPAPNQTGDCGYGKTILRRMIVKKREIVIQPEQKEPEKKKTPFQDMNQVPKKQTAKNNPVTKHKPVTIPQKNKTTVKLPDNKKNITTLKTSDNKNQIKNPDVVKRDSVVKQQIPIIGPPLKKETQSIPTDLKFDKRINTVMKTIQIKNQTFTVDFYDNGEIDGDSISVFFNGKLLLSHQRLGYKAIELKLNFDQSRAVNELVMYAENLGEIPPNTALMVVHDGDNRYEARIESDLGRNGTIRFTYKPEDSP